MKLCAFVWCFLGLYIVMHLGEHWSVITVEIKDCANLSAPLGLLVTCRVCADLQQLNYMYFVALIKHYR